jgi:osmoprotectant transport system permease protein
MKALFAFWIAHRGELAALLGQHVVLVTASTVVAVVAGVPLGIFSARRPRLASPLIGLASVVQTIPSLAMFGFLLPVPLVGGVGARAALVVLILYGLLPIVRTTIAGLRSIDPAIREAGVAMGMTPRELLRQVELPLALPSIVAGVRVAAVVAVGSATIAAAIGAGGLGEYIYRGRRRHRIGCGDGAGGQRRSGASHERRDNRRIEKLYGTAGAGRARCANHRARRRHAGAPPAQSGRHSHLRRRSAGR